jgi:hypothetical protein
MRARRAGWRAQQRHNRKQITHRKQKKKEQWKRHTEGESALFNLEIN